MNNDPIKEELKESLSAVMDGEAEELEFRRVLHHFHDEELRGTAKRYQLINDTIKYGGMGTLPNIDVSNRIRAEIEEEKNIIEPRFQKHRKRGIMGLAVAASITLAVIVGVRTWNMNDSSQRHIQLASNIDSGHNAGILLSGNDDNTIVQVPEKNVQGGRVSQNTNDRSELKGVKKVLSNMQALERFRAYGLNHVEQLVENSVQGIVPLMRVIDAR